MSPAAGERTVATLSAGTDLIGFKFRVTALMMFCLAFASAVVLRAAQVQVVNHPRLEQMARRQFQSKTLVRPRRGPILDRSGEPLAINIETKSLAANPSKIENPRAMAKLLAHVTQLPYAKLHKLLVAKEDREFLWIKRHLNEGEMHLLKKWRLLDADGELRSGLMLVKESKRMYPHGELAAHVLGDVNVDSDGLEGVELWQNEKMRGKIVSVSAIKDAMGRPTFIDAVSARTVQDHRDGEPVGLTLDASLQYAVEQSLKASVARHSARGGTVIVMNAVSGEVLAMANQPAFNPNDRGTPAERRRNRALTDGYEPGSTMKSVLAASALSHGWHLTDRVWGENGAPFLVQGKRISEAEAHEKYEWISLQRILQVSSNVGAAKVALKHGADNYLAMLKAMGFGARSGSGFPGEISGQVPPRKAWQPLTLANIGFGQGILVTPMQMTRAYATFLNGGWLVQPKFLKDAAVPPPSGAEAPRRVISQKVADQVLDALESVTRDDGTGVKAALPGYRVAGKTGTAQKIDPATRGYSRSKYVSSFIGMAIGVEPKLVIFTAVDEPKGAYYAADVAVPLFKEVLNATANRFSMPSRALAQGDQLPASQAAPALPARMAQSIAKLSLTVEEPGGLRLQGNDRAGKMVWVMPTLKGLTAREALRAMQGHDLKMEVKGTGLVRAQFPEEGRPLTEGETVKVSLGEPQ